jgi:hypothetical protein
MTDAERLNAIVRDITTRQVTMYDGRPSTPCELMAREIIRLRASVEELTGARRNARAEFDGRLQTNIVISGPSQPSEHLKRMLAAEIDAALRK